MSALIFQGILLRLLQQASPSAAQMLSEDEVNTETPQMKCKKIQNSMTKTMESVPNEDFDGIPFLSGKPFFDINITRSHTCPHYNLVFPARIYRKLPRATVPAVLRYKCKNWRVSYQGCLSYPRLDGGWRIFANENKLAVGDVCIFEVMASSEVSIKFKVHVLKNEVPPELRQPTVSYGTPSNPIELD
ncbi:B3 domain-containing protein Os06g0112300-like [Andrographis paniculata]|uniref:B3 domain-containing protein Os06g0112300-like n=1 Tax=Andrographis paniculata TaxID=175694 RepID=UPI0021E8E54D|nr:B3 domain-containing protein Os06g0112300-like [Andrographis paniculata]